MPTCPPTIDEIIAAIRERDSGRTFHEHSVIRWDTALANEVERLRDALSAVVATWPKVSLSGVMEARAVLRSTEGRE